ncbi:MAG: helix-turn-helix domain-containing protein [Bacilli bacterium]|nr:helix-turn-helix domain-containing protein [Bacilli bacterium]
MKMQFYSLKDLLIFNIKYFRFKNNMSQEKLAELCSFSSRYMTDIERGMHCPTINKLEVIAKSLDVEPFELFQNHKYDEDIVAKIVKNRQYNQK